MVEKKVKKLILDRDRWVHGRLVTCNGQKGQYCAIGAYLTQVGISPETLQEAEGGSLPYQIDRFKNDLPEEANWLLRRVLTSHYLSKAAVKIMKASDGQKEQTIKDTFQEHDVEVEFVGEYDG